MSTELGVLDALGLYLIGVDRPGYGASCRDPRRSFQVRGGRRGGSGRKRGRRPGVSPVELTGVELLQASAAQSRLGQSTVRGCTHTSASPGAQPAPSHRAPMTVAAQLADTAGQHIAGYVLVHGACAQARGR
jgi:hypothetical protein